MTEPAGDGGFFLAWPQKGKFSMPRLAPLPGASFALLLGLSIAAAPASAQTAAANPAGRTAPKQ
jgi:hypothetical protein